MNTPTQRVLRGRDHRFKAPRRNAIERGTVRTRVLELLWWKAASIAALGLRRLSTLSGRWEGPLSGTLPKAEKALAIDGDDPRANYIVGIAKANHGDRGAVPYLQRATHRPDLRR